MFKKKNILLTIKKVKKMIGYPIIKFALPKQFKTLEFDGMNASEKRAICVTNGRRITFSDELQANEILCPFTVSDEETKDFLGYDFKN